MLLKMIIASAVASGVSAEEAKFEQFWQQSAKTSVAAGMSKATTLVAWEWMQTQFSAGFCASIINADVIDAATHLPNEAELMRSEIGRQLIGHGRSSYGEGVKYRRETKPTPKLCLEEMTERAAALRWAADKKD